MSALAAPPPRFSTAPETLSCSVGRTSLGALAVAESERGICAIALGDDEDAVVNELASDFPRAELRPANSTALAAVKRLIENPRASFSLPLDLRGTPFQQRVWNALRQIPAGQTATYSSLAAEVGAPLAVRAVAGACAANKLAVIIPCHRVIRRSGNLAGYRWGTARKRALLEREGASALLPLA